jgi:hypothetical protein
MSTSFWRPGSSERTLRNRSSIPTSPTMVATASEWLARYSICSGEEEL